MKAFHVSQAVLDLNTVNDNAPVQVWANIDDADHLIANFSKSSSQCLMDLTFTEGETVAFFTKGTGTVHLSGYLIPEDDDGFGALGMGEEEDDEEMESEQDELELASPSKKQLKANKDKKNAKKVANEESDEDDGKLNLLKVLVAKIY